MVPECLARPRVGWSSPARGQRGAAPLFFLAAVAGLVLACGAGNAGAQVAVTSQLNRSAPTASYYLIFGAYDEGEFREAFKDFRSEARGAIKAGPGNYWIDSICYQTMMGECNYHMGNLPAALDCYTNALNMALAFSDWMVRVQFDPVIQPVTQARLIPWGASTRNFVLGRYSDTQLTAQGQIDQRAVIVQGGVVQPPILYPLSVKEIVRCTCLAMRRRRDLLGPVAVHDKLTSDLVSAFSRRQGQLNHWSEVYLDAQLGVAYAMAGKDAQARKALESSVVAAGEYDHPLTATVFLELGRLALKGGDFRAAETCFAEATYSAYYFPDPALLEEAFRYGFMNHVLGNKSGPYPPLVLAAQWAGREGLRFLQASLLTLAAENSCMINDPDSAATLLNTARQVMGRRTMLLGRPGCRMNFTAALAFYQAGDVADGDAALASAMKFQTGGSLWLFHMGLVDNLWTSNNVSDRQAIDLYTSVLRDPTTADWSTDPLEALSALIIPHHLIFEHWFEVALATKQHERALEIADMVRRHRFLTTLDMGGRLLSLRWVLEGPVEVLDQQAQLQRQDLLIRYPAYDQLSQQARQIRTDLEQMPLASDDPEVRKTQAAALAKLGDVSQAQEVLLRQIAIRRDPCNTVFPPIRTTKEVQAALANGQALLAFFSTSRYAYAFLMSNDKYAYWKLGAPSTVQKQVMNLLRAWGNFGENKSLGMDDLQNEDWKKPAQQVLELLTKDSKADLATLFNEIVIVPDGLLWYVPFEALEIKDNDQYVPLISKIRVRYAPTVGLGVADARPRHQMTNTAVVLGRLFPKAEDQVALDAFDEMGQSISGATPIRAPLPAASALYSTLFRSMIVLADVPTATGGAYNWLPIPGEKGSAGNTLGHWFSLPWGGPEQVMLPGFHTAAEGAIKKQNIGTLGMDVFLSLCGMMSTGTRTVLMSRWRTGGQTSFDLVREFAQELPHTTAADAWQRSVLLVSNEELSPEKEPRLKRDTAKETMKAEHPFFWAGYLLADSGAPPVAPDEAAAADKIIKQQPGGKQPQAGPRGVPGAGNDPGQPGEPAPRDAAGGEVNQQPDPSDKDGGGAGERDQGPEGADPAIQDGNAADAKPDPKQPDKQPPDDPHGKSKKKGKTKGKGKSSKPAAKKPSLGP